MHRRSGPTAVSPYITSEGARQLRAELDELWLRERPKVAQAVGEAAALGDRSENAEYIYGKKRLREIDRRIRYLQKRLDEVVIVDREPGDTSRVFFGAWVRIEREDGEVFEYRIVGSDETGFDAGAISVDSPLARALLRRAEGEEVAVVSPQGQQSFVIVSVRYRRD
jgi:transcription elongation factor GreB